MITIYRCVNYAFVCLEIKKIQHRINGQTKIIGGYLNLSLCIHPFENLQIRSHYSRNLYHNFYSTPPCLQFAPLRLAMICLKVRSNSIIINVWKLIWSKYSLYLNFTGKNVYDMALSRGGRVYRFCRFFFSFLPFCRFAVFVFNQKQSKTGKN